MVAPPRSRSLGGAGDAKEIAPLLPTVGMYEFLTAFSVHSMLGPMCVLFEDPESKSEKVFELYGGHFFSK